MKKLKNWKHFNEDVYWTPKDIHESGTQVIERIQKWVEKWVDEMVGLEIVNVNVSDDMISIKYKKGERWEDRKIPMMGSMSKEEAMKASKLDWKQMGEEMVQEMKYDRMQGYEDGLGLDLEDDYSIVSSPNGFYIKYFKDFPKKVIGQSRNTFGG